jgi:hypothetical protein
MMGVGKKRSRVHGVAGTLVEEARNYGQGSGHRSLHRGQGGQRSEQELVHGSEHTGKTEVSDES